MNEDYAARLPTFPLFQGMTAYGARRLLETGSVREYGAGDVLFREGDAPTWVLLLLGGRLRVFAEREGLEVVLTSLEPGAVLGELAVLCGMPRSASVCAHDAATVLAWDGPAFRKLLLGDPFLSERILGKSLRTLVERERELIDSLARARRPGP